MAVSLILLGMIGMIAQAAFLREIMATFRGGELTIGTALLFWLLWTSAGSGILGKWNSRHPDPAGRFHMLIPWYGLLGYLGVLVIRHLPLFARLTPGELVSYDLQVAAVSLAFAPFNLLGGYLFVAGARASASGQTASPVGRAYTYEAAGAAAGGIMVSLGAWDIFPNSMIAFGCVLIAAGTSVRWYLGGEHRQRTLMALLPLGAAVALLVLSSLAAGHQYRGQVLMEERDTRFGRLRVTRTGEQTTFSANASFLFSAPDPESSEYAAHIPMLAAPEPRRVLIIGGGPGGIIDEVLRYDTVSAVTCVELDPLLFSLAARYLDERWRDDARVTAVNTDGRAFLRKTRERFDVVIMNMPEPLSGVANRYYTEEWYGLVADHLTPNGIFAFSLSGAENYIPDRLAYFLASIRRTLRQAFPSAAVLPGDPVRFLAGESPGMFRGLGWEMFSKECEERGLDLAYVRDYYLRYLLTPMRMETLTLALDSAPSPSINTDTRPAAYVTRTVLEGERDGSFLIRTIAPFLEVQVLGMVMAVLAALILVPAVIPGRSAPGRTIGACVVSVGLTEISLEVLAILAYQSIFGFLYARIALLTGSYMVGLAIGGFVGTRLSAARREGFGMLALIQGGIAVIPLLWMGLLYQSVGAGVLREVGFYLLTAAAGVAGGVQFPLADSLFRRIRSPRVTETGFIYALDLAGSSIGALITASFMIPLIGMVPALAFFTAINAGLGGLLMFHRPVEAG
ncbi:fused MFS/spermidine synthase [Candidatus Latescibacterota bacterium]